MFKKLFKKLLSPQVPHKFYTNPHQYFKIQIKQINISHEKKKYYIYQYNGNPRYVLTESIITNKYFNFVLPYFYKNTFVSDRSTQLEADQTTK